MKFIGHLDIMRYFQKVMRRADVDIRYSEGFSPHQIMSFAAPLGVGLESRGEYVDIEVLSTDSSKEMLRRINENMVEGMEALSYKALPDDAGNAMSLVVAADYEVRFREGYEPADLDAFFAGIPTFLEQEEIVIVKKTKKGRARGEYPSADLPDGSPPGSCNLFTDCNRKRGKLKAGCRPSCLCRKPR